MKISELINILENMPAEAEASFLQTASNVVTVEEIEHRECFTQNGKKFDIVVFSGLGED